ncbi:CvfB family protein [methane-oxidizing endosymbiont of Gigantopelta aegis]|uniref:CvfB family protein n=1 Tax=methane-oxidizing endosymbiont of Gigantopelta aegis TaxID=2794938 RepID=UPI0018DAFC49|nr:S1-like domain-containing RNA-binding protein [methane-oxidizing endosymbiont of Gigantopelta aegis]
MLKIGRFNSLKIVRKRDDSVWLEGTAEQELMLQDPAVADKQEGDTLDVFIYTDGQGGLLATLKKPKAQVGEVAFLPVVATGKVGAFLDWGLPKDLFVPFSEQKQKMQVGRSYLVRLFLDEDNRIAASTMLDDFILDEAVYLKQGDEVDLMIAGQTELGYKAVVNHKFWGLLYKNETFQPLKIGQQCRGYIKQIRPDKRIDLILDRAKFADKVDQVSDAIMQALQQQGGHLPLNDKSAPETIYRQFGVSKKIFKQAIGRLYKARQIEINENSIKQVNIPSA